MYVKINIKERERDDNTHYGETEAGILKADVDGMVVLFRKE